MRTGRIAVALMFLLIGTCVSVNASDGLRFGVRAGVNRNMFSIYRSPDIEKGWDFGAGLAAKIPLTRQLRFSPEANLYYRESGVQFYYSDYIKGFYDYYITEMVISVPAMIQFMPDKNTPSYLTAGVQLDFPFRNRLLVVTKENSSYRPINNRAAVDFGIPFGIGVIIRNVCVDFRYVINLNRPFHDWGSSLKSFGLGVSYFL